MSKSDDRFNSLKSFLTDIPRLGVIQELIQIPQPQPNLLHHDLLKINKLTDEIYGLLLNFQQALEVYINKSDDDGLEWYYDGKSDVIDLIEDTESIDGLISEILTVIDSSESSIDPQDLSGLLSKLETTSDLQLDVKKSLILLKRKVDISINYKEINETIIKSLKDEILLCIECFHKILESKLSSPNRLLPKFDLAQITAKMKINDLSSHSNTNFSTKSLRLPTFNDFDESLYNDYLMLESRIKPLKVSLEFLPLKINEFNHLCSKISPQTANNIQITYNELMDNWNYLQLELENLKSESLDKRWNEIFKYLINEITYKCKTLREELRSKNSSNDGDLDASDAMDIIGPAYKLCSNSITMINKAFTEGTITDSSLVPLFNEKLLPEWDLLNNTLMNASPLPSSSHRLSKSVDKLSSNDHSLDENGLRTLQTVKRRSSMFNSGKKNSPSSDPLGTIDENDDKLERKSFSSRRSILIDLPQKSQLNTVSSRSSSTPSELVSPSALGIDLGVSVDQVSSKSTPFSIEQKDKVRDFLANEKNGNPNSEQNQFLEMKRKNLKQSLMRLNGGVDIDDDEDDEATLVHATPKLSYDLESSFSDSRMSRSTLARNLYSIQELFNYLMKNSRHKPTKLPLIRDDYTSLGLPVIKKCYIDSSRPSRIPSISPNHPVFQSPQRKPSKDITGRVDYSPTKNTPIEVKSQRTLKPPLFAMKRNSLLKKPMNDSTNTTRNTKNSTLNQKQSSLEVRNNAKTSPNSVDSNARSSISLSRLSGVSLSGMNTPNLSYSHNMKNSPEAKQRMSLLSNISPSASLISSSLSYRSSSPTRQLSPIRSTSPERPNSSIGSRFDEVHLIQPLKKTTTKSAWR